MNGGVDRFRYGANRSKLIIGCLFFAACAVVIALKADGNDRGVIINHLIELDQSSATTFYWVLVALSVGLAVVGGIGIIRSFGAERWVVLDHHAITSPKSGISTQSIRIAYDAIADCAVHSVRGQPFLRVQARDGRKLYIMASSLDGENEFDNLCAALVDRWRKRH